MGKKKDLKIQWGKKGHDPTFILASYFLKKVFR